MLSAPPAPSSPCLPPLCTFQVKQLGKACISCLSSAVICLLIVVFGLFALSVVLNCARMSLCVSIMSSVLLCAFCAPVPCTRLFISRLHLLGQDAAARLVTQLSPGTCTAHGCHFHFQGDSLVTLHCIHLPLSLWYCRILGFEICYKPHLTVLLFCF